MSTLAVLSAPLWTRALGWTLLHFVWQGALVALLLWCGLALLDGRSSRLRYALCCAALALVAVLPAATFVQLGGVEGSGGGNVLAAPWLLEVQAGGGSAAASWTARIAEMLNAAAPVLPWIWLAGVAVCAIRLGIGLAIARRMRQRDAAAADTGVEAIFCAVADRLGVRRVVRLLESARVEVPTVIGWLRPAVLLPLGCFAGLSTMQVEALLAHELAHIRRHDYLVSVLQSVLEALLFYHPAVWWVSSQVRRERECCCDEIAAAVAGDRLEYARALSLLEEQRISGPAIVLGANGGVLTMRIRRLLGYRQGTVASQMGAVAVLGAVLLSAGVFAVRSALGQNSEAPGFRRSAAFLSVAAQSRAAGTLSGVVTDPTGALVPRATVDASDTATGQRETQQTGNDGRFRFGLPGGSYLVEVYARGFQPAIRENVAVNSDTAPELSFRLAVGAVSQELKVSAARSSAAPPAGSGRGAGAPVMVSGATMAGNAVHQPPPLYPAEAKEKHIQGTVVLQATISKTGEVENLRVVSGPEELQSSALDAVRQWQYKPYLLNGEPVAVSTTIRVNYTLGPDGPPAATQGAPGASVQGAGRPLRVSAGVMAGQVIQQTPPEYPAEAKSKGIQGVVVLRARISKEGNVEDLQVESGPDELRQSAIDAVKQWTYKPFLLNGEPVAVDTTIHVNYTLAPS